jgi:hypothetical protein
LQPIHDRPLQKKFGSFGSVWPRLHCVRVSVMRAHAALPFLRLLFQLRSWDFFAPFRVHLAMCAETLVRD